MSEKAGHKEGQLIHIVRSLAKRQLAFLCIMLKQASLHIVHVHTKLVLMKSIIKVHHQWTAAHCAKGGWVQQDRVPCLLILKDQHFVFHYSHHVLAFSSGVRLRTQLNTFPSQTIFTLSTNSEILTSINEVYLFWVMNLTSVSPSSQRWHQMRNWFSNIVAALNWFPG